MRDLTEQQAAFVLHYTSTPGALGNAAESARRAGYSEASARELGRQLLDKPHIRAAVDEANRQNLSGRIYTKAVGLLERMIDDESVSMKVRLDAAKAVIDRAERARAAEPERDAGAAASGDRSKVAELAAILAGAAEGGGAGVAERLGAKLSVVKPA